MHPTVQQHTVILKRYTGTCMAWFQVYRDTLEDDSLTISPVRPIAYTKRDSKY